MRGDRGVGLQKMLGVVAALAALAGGGGCASNESLPVPQVDMAACVGAVCTGGCDVDGDCQGGRHCRVDRHQCVDCLHDADCSDGLVCSPLSSNCVRGCAAGHGCGDAGVCEPDAGVCEECGSDADCTSPGRPRCDPLARRCVPCLPDHDNCGFASYCAGVPGGVMNVCAPGCKNDSDCPAAPDGGAPDGGVPGGPLCDLASHTCGPCLVDDDCPIGKICAGGNGGPRACVDGCTDKHGCAMSAVCCGGRCADLTSDPDHCGACGTACNGGWNCCKSTCVNPTSSTSNCGGCGVVCSVPRGTPACVMRACAVDSCDAGWADCNGVYRDGCETHTDVNIGNCGQCGNACSIPRALPRCAGGACLIDVCIPPWADCNGKVDDGCEASVDADVANCGGCGLACATPHATPRCARGQCGVAQCDAGWSDCNLLPVDGCEVHSDVDANNCGACGKTCPGNGLNANAGCVNGACRFACLMGFADCDMMANNGCEVATQTDTMNCGGCGMACSGNHIAQPTCSLGFCNGVCDVGFADCNNDKRKDGCESAVASDPANCGACGKVCPGVCANGICTITLQPDGASGLDTYFGTVYTQGGNPTGEYMSYGGWGDFYYDFLQFDLSTLPPSAATAKAVIEVSSQGYFAPNDPRIQVWQITQPWVPAGVTLQNHPAAVYLQDMGPTVNGWNTIDITPLYRIWKDGGAPNYGIELVPTANNQTNGGFAQSENHIAAIRPRIVITMN